VGGSHGNRDAGSNNYASEAHNAQYLCLSFCTFVCLASFNSRRSTKSSNIDPHFSSFYSHVCTSEKRVGVFLRERVNVTGGKRKRVVVGRYSNGNGCSFHVL
jgi:hypothetical protein